MKRNDIIGLIFALIGLNLLSLLLVNLTYNGYFEMQQMALKNLAALYSQNFNLSAILSTGMAYISFIVIVVLFFCLGKYGISRFFPEKKKKRKKKPQNKAHKKQANKIVPKSTSIQKAPVKKPTPKPATPQKAPVKKPTPKPATPQKAPVKKPTPKPATPQKAPVKKPTPKPATPQKAPVKKPTPKPATPQKAPVKKPTPSTNRKPPIKK